jgi:hypothetical protein
MNDVINAEVLNPKAVPSSAVQNSRILDELLSEAFLTRLENLAAEKSTEYLSNQPFPNIYFDNFFPERTAEAALADFPEPKEIEWHQFRDPNQRKKLAFDVAERLPSSLRDILFFLNSRPMLQFLEVLTGIKAIMPDPYFNGGGLHQIKPGGLLEVHADFSYLKQLRMDRRINVLIYLNKDWKEEYGGHFELWNKEITRSEKRILPVFNRCAIFSTTSTSYHGHPNPLTCPPDRTRKSIATYYYSNGRPEEAEGVTHRHEVDFRERPGINSVKAALGMKKFAVSLLPPILTDIYKSLRK